MPLRNIHFSLVDVPDLLIIPTEHPTLTDIWMGAGPVPEILHRMLNLIAKARARFGLPSLVPFSRLFYTVLNMMKFGEHRGGMFIHARGVNNGKIFTHSWHLLAEGDDGPYIPSMAIEAIIRKYTLGDQPEVGARSGAHALELGDYEKLFHNRNIFTGFRKEEGSSPLYRQLLGSAFNTLPLKVQELHGVNDVRHWKGTADVRRGSGMMAKLICNVIGFPQTAFDVPIAVSFLPKAKGELWTRNFNGRIFSSFQKSGSKKNDYLLIEKFGIFNIALALVIDADRLFFVPRSWSCLGIPLPKTLLPTGRSFESEKDGQFYFDVEISAPVIGLIVTYKGILNPM